MAPLWLLQVHAALSAQPADSAARVFGIDTLRGAALDSVVVRNPLPAGIDAVSRWLFNLPRWLQIGGFMLGVLVAVAILVVVWRRRRALLAWLAARSRAWKIAYAVAAGALVLAAATGGAATWSYTQHDNDFCVSCHVMTPAFQRFRTSEHRKLSCHACHQQSIFASARQVYYWVAERPQDIPPHAPVPTRICASCHVQRDADSTWKRIVATAGHRVHLFSDSSALKGKVQCVTCHGQEVHRFVPTNETCGQSGCHDQKDTRIRLGKMASQTAMHCTGCHQFTRGVTEVASLDSSRGAMTPGQKQCLACHQMRARLAEFDARREPHGATCGACHNPHVQETPKKAFESCATAGCHAGADTITPMHRGLPARTVADCGQCHQAHEWKVQSTSCLDCHADVLGGRGAGRAAHAPRRAAVVARPLQLASAAGTDDLLARYVARHVATLARGAQPPERPARPAARRPAFSHPVHRDVACTACHTSERRHGETLVRTARDCATCHHRADRATSCTGCHAEREPTPPTRVAVRMTTAAGRAPHERALPFAHAPHRDVGCRDCHTAPVTLAVERGCTSCHAEHHVATADCLACHAGPVKAAHRASAHEGCAGSACHASAVAASLAPRRAVCLSCHQDQTRHKPGRECADCHRVSWPSVAERRP